MDIVMNKSLYSDMVAIAKDYLGPAADRFIARHIEAHLHIKPSDITSKDVPELLAWLSMSFSLLTPDAKMIAEFNSKFWSLVK